MSLFNELKRRNVFRVAIAYIVVAWLSLQLADIILGNIAFLSLRRKKGRAA